MCRLLTPMLWLLAVSGLVCLTDNQSLAGWIIIKNETKSAVTITDTNKGKPITIQPGESYREYQMNAGNKTVNISVGPQQNNKLAVREKLTWTTEDTQFSIRADGNNVKLVQETKSKK